LGTWLDLTTTHRQTWLFSSTSTYHSTDLLTTRGVAHLVVHGTSGSTSYETIPDVRLESSGDVLSTVDMVVQRRDGPRWLRELDDDNDEEQGLMCTAYSLLINVDKTKVMASDGIACRILIQNEQLEQVDTFPYLRSLITEDGIPYQIKQREGDRGITAKSMEK